MSFESDDFKRVLREFFCSSDLDFAISSQWSSKKDDYRKSLRQALVAVLEQEGDSVGNEREELLDLNKIPQQLGYSFSLSHCPLLGGWAAVRSPLQIGLDIEVQERIKMKQVERICAQTEIKESPDPRYLWCAKESAYKALLNLRQPKVVTALTIYDWKQVRDIDMLSFKADSVKAPVVAAGKGLLGAFSGVIMAFFIIRP